MAWKKSSVQVRSGPHMPKYLQVLCGFLLKYGIEVLIFLAPAYWAINEYVLHEITLPSVQNYLAIIGVLFVSVRTRTLVKEYQSRVREKAFNEYHKLIRVINGVEDHFKKTDKDSPAMEVQCAAVYELRNYPQYKDFTYRTLRWLVDREGDRKKAKDDIMAKFSEKYSEEGLALIEPLVEGEIEKLLQSKTARYQEEVRLTLLALGYNEPDIGKVLQKQPPHA